MEKTPYLCRPFLRERDVLRKVEGLKIFSEKVLKIFGGLRKRVTFAIPNQKRPLVRLQVLQKNSYRDDMAFEALEWFKPADINRFGVVRHVPETWKSSLKIWKQ